MNEWMNDVFILSHVNKNIIHSFKIAVFSAIFVFGHLNVMSHYINLI